MTTVIGSGRMRFPQAAADPVYGQLFAELPDGTAPWIGGVYNPARWAHDQPGHASNPTYPVSGPLEFLVDSDPGRPVLGVIAHGFGTLTFEIGLSPNGVWVGSAGEVIEVSASVAINGVVIGSQTQTVVIPGWVVGFVPGFFFTGTIDVADGDVITAGLLTNKTPAIYAYSAGTGQGLPFNVFGSLAAEEIASFSMRGSGVTARAL